MSKTTASRLVSAPLLTALLLVTAIQPAQGQGLPREMLAALKRATVLVKAKFHPSDVTGSGFLFDKQGGDGFITTNAHVVAPGQADPKIEIVFDSGLSSERTVSGQLVAKDEQADLAIVKVTLADLPAPVAISRPVECYETMPILMLGFPFGGALARTRRNPEITVSEGRISSLRNDRHGRLAAIQIDGSINPGNSGGPVVSHSGELIGIAVAKVRGTQIGFVIPAAELREMLLGRIVQATAQQVEAANAQATFKISVDVADPGRHVKNVAVWTIRADQAKDDPQPNKDHWFGRLSDRMQKHSLERGEGRAFGFFRLPLDPAAAVDTHYRYQLSFERDDGSERFSEPVNLVAKTVANPQKAEFPPRRPPDPAPSVPTGPGIPGNLISAMMRAGDAITSPATRVPPREHQPRFPFPKPKATAAGSRRLVSQPISGAEGATATALPVRASRPDDPLVSQRTTAAWSADGDSVFILDADNVLWRFGIANGNVIEQARLSVEAECQDMALSQEGLVIALSSASALWVVNPTTLEVIREIPVADVRAVAAGAGSSIACTLAGPSTLSVIDLKQGMIVNSLEMNQPRVGSVFSGYCRSLRMTPDGKTLFVGTTCIVRIAVEGSELRFLEKSEELNSAGASLVLISPDGHFVATRNGGRFAVYDAANLKEKILLLPTTGSSVTLDLDSVMQRAIVGSDGQLQFFSLRGGKQAEFGLPWEGLILRVLASSRGRRFLVWGERTVGVVQVAARE